MHELELLKQDTIEEKLDSLTEDYPVREYTRGGKKVKAHTRGESKKHVLQIQNSAGKWSDIDADKIESMMNSIMKREEWYAERVGRKPIKSKEEFLTFL